MRKALILHGTSDNSQENWFSWLGNGLETLGYSVWIPDLPNADKPNMVTYNTFLQNRQNWSFDAGTVLIGHSSGAVAILGLLQELSALQKVDACYLVGAFKDNLNWESLDALFLKPFDFAKIKSQAQQFHFIHSDNDPYCPLEHAKFLATNLAGKLHVLADQQHFSISTAGEKYRQFPFLLELIKQNQ